MHASALTLPPQSAAQANFGSRPQRTLGDSPVGGTAECSPRETSPRNRLTGLLGEATRPPGETTPISGGEDDAFSFRQHAPAPLTVERSTPGSSTDGGTTPGEDGRHSRQLRSRLLLARKSLS